MHIMEINGELNPRVLPVTGVYILIVVVIVSITTRMLGIISILEQ